MNAGETATSYPPCLKQGWRRPERPFSLPVIYARNSTDWRAIARAHPARRGARSTRRLG